MKRKMTYFLKKAEKVPKEQPFKRVGIIPYFIHDGEIFLFLMLDSKFGELTDCGGLPKPKETWMETAIRETDEESRSFFKFKRECILDKGDLFWREDNRIAIIFMDVSSKFRTKNAASSFCYRYRVSYLRGIRQKDHRNRLENSDMIYYSLNQINYMVKYTRQIYFPVKMLLLKFLRMQIGPLLSRKTIQSCLPPDWMSRPFGENTSKLEILEETTLLQEE